MKAQVSYKGQQGRNISDRERQFSFLLEAILSNSYIHVLKINKPQKRTNQSPKHRMKLHWYVHLQGHQHLRLHDSHQETANY